jgi:hypothetical protein
MSLNIVLCHLHTLRLFGFRVCWVNSIFLSLVLLHFMLITPNAILIATYLVIHKCTKHIEADCYSICEARDQYIITLPYIFTEF